MKFYPYERGGAENVLAMLKAEETGGTKSFKVVLTQELEVLAIVMGGGGAKSFHPLKGGGTKSLPCLERGRKMFWTRDFPIL